MTSDERLLDAKRLHQEVRAKTGIRDVHETELGDRLERLLRHFDEDMGLDDNGRRSAYETVLDLLISRAGLLEDRRRYPDLAEAAVERSIFVTGLPRSGTTLLHSLLAADPDSRAPAWWESLRPSPPPGISTPDDPRIARADADVAAFVGTQPNILLSHPYFDQGGQALMECEALGVTDFRHILRAAYFRVPGVITIALNDDEPEGLYRYHRMVLQALQWRRPVKRWALKGTEHHVRLEALKAVYPDAIVVWLHRDPQKVFPSLMELLSSVSEGITGQEIDRPTFGRRILARYGGMLDAAMKSPLIDHPDVHHLLYADFAKDPIAAISSIYARAGLPFGARQSDAMLSWRDDPANKGDRHGRFKYTLAAFEMTTDFIERRTSDYRQRFQIPYE